MTETDDNVKETTSAVNKVGKHLKQNFIEEKNKETSEKEDKKDSIRLMSKMSKTMESASNAIKDSFLGKAIGGTLDSIGSVIKNIVKGGLLLSLHLLDLKSLLIVNYLKQFWIKLQTL